MLIEILLYRDYRPCLIVFEKTMPSVEQRNPFWSAPKPSSAKTVT
jgi:hypothetical protein